MDRRKNLEDRRKIARDRRKNNTVFASIIKLLFCSFIAIMLILVVSLLLDIKIMLTDSLDQQNYIRQELDKQSAENRSEVDSEALTSEARDIIERVVAAEARGEDLQGMMAVAQVIKDRSDLWGMHPVDVVFAEGQFAKPYEGEISDEIHLAVANVFGGGMRVFSEPTTHFYSGKEPYWADEKVNRGSVGNHRFYY